MTNKLNGTWVPIEQEMEGAKLPSSSFEKQKMILQDDNYTVIAESIDKGVVKFSGSNQLDIFGKDGVNKGKHFNGIYKYENDRLTICYNLQGTGYPGSFETARNPFFFLSVFKREGDKK